MFFGWAAPGLLLSLFSVFSLADDLTIANRRLSVAVRNQDGAYEIRSNSRTVLRSMIGAEMNHRWIKSSEYPKHKILRASFHDTLGTGQQLTVIFSGLAGKPNLSDTRRLYDDLSFGDIRVQLLNNGSRGVTVQHIRCVEAVGDPSIDLAGPDSSDRVLS